MENEWLDLAYINLDKIILHGQYIDGYIERQIEQVLTDAQKELLGDLDERHAQEKKALLRSFVAAEGGA